jgi:two-component system LytT family response regulator
MIKAMIVDDKTAAIELLRWLIKEHCPEITSVVSATSVGEALPLIHNFKPDVLFLDIQMPRETGFDLLAKVKQWNFEVIFTTAYNEFAIQAIRFSALDYLLKPVDPDALAQALERYKAKRVYEQGGESLYRNFIQNITADKSRPLRLALPGMSDIKYVELSDIIHLQADSNYTKLYFTKGKSFLSSKTLLEYEKTLDQSGFIRVHKSHMVNAMHIAGYNKQGLLTLSDGAEIEVSRRKRGVVLDLFRNK